MNIDKAMEALGYNDIRESIKGYTSSNLGMELVEQMVPKTDPKIVLKCY